VTFRPSARDGEIEAFVVDRYLESLLAREPRDTADIPVDLRQSADALAAGLPRYHPSFRCVEALSARLAAAAVRPAGAAPRDPMPAAIVELPRPGRPGDAPGGLGQVRPVVIGGVLTSAAISLAGAAYVAWRLNRPASDPMIRAVRAVARARLI
jgi:hypothetical protein